MKAPAHLDSQIIVLISAYLSLYVKPIKNTELDSQLDKRKVANGSYQEKLTIMVYLLYENYFIYIIKLDP